MQARIDEQLSLEIRGERAANRIRIFLILVFSAAAAVGILIGNLGPVARYYFAGISMFASVFLFSTIMLATKRYAAWVKYVCMPVEVGALIFVQGSFLLLPANMHSLTVKSVPLYGIYLIFIAMAFVRFSPKFTLITSAVCAAGYTLLLVLLLNFTDVRVKRGDAVYLDAAGVPLSDFITSIMFMFALGALLAGAARLVRDVVSHTESAGQAAKKRLVQLHELARESNGVIKDLGTMMHGLASIAGANEEQSKDQLAAVEQTSATVEEMSASIRSIADQARAQDALCDKNSTAMHSLNVLVKRIETLAREASQSGNSTLTNALSGEKELAGTVEGITRIQSASNRVAEIVTVINGIADRTNLLALNAAIEAARAGAEGRGFTVVADEVGKLAELSSRNAREIERLIKETKVATEDGVKAIQDTVLQLGTIIDGIKQMVQITREVNGLVGEQTDAAVQVLEQTEKIQHMSREMRHSTEEQLSATQEIVGAIDSMNINAEKLSQSTLSLRGMVRTLTATNQRLQKQAEEAL